MSFVEQAVRWPFKLASYAKRRVYAAVAVHPTFSAISADAEILEIGGGYNPRFKSAEFPNVRHLDHLSREGLIDKYKNDHYARHLISNIQHIDYVCSSARITSCIVDKKFDIVYSRHAIEHQVNLIEHFQDIESILDEGGCAILEIPYLSACFDMFRFPTTTGDVICQHIYNKKNHQGKQIFDCVAQTVSFNDGRKPSFLDVMSVKFSNEISLAHQKVTESIVNNESYEDSHAWTFTPTSFTLLMVELGLLELTNLRADYVTKPYGNTFMVKLVKSTKGNDRNQALQEERIRLTKRLYRKNV